MAKVKKTIRSTKKVYSSPFSIYWIKENYYLLTGGVLLLIVAFYMMSIGEWDHPLGLNISPIILILAYLVIFPLSIFFRKKKEKNESTGNP